MRSDAVKKGAERAPHRSLFYALGCTAGDWDRPFVGVINSYNHIIPGHMHLDAISRAVHEGVRSAGGVPFEMNTIGICDGIAMNHPGMKYSLPSRGLSPIRLRRWGGTSIRRTRVRLQLRQDSARHADGRSTSQRSGHSRCGGPMMAGHVYDGGELRTIDLKYAVGRLERPSREHDGGRPRGMATQCMPRLRQLLRHVHRQHHELHDGGPGHGASRQRHHTGYARPEA